jgi:hypothetical protein
MSGTGGNKMFAQWWGDVKVQSVIFVQRLPTRTVAASKAHHCANTNVVGNKAGIPRIAIGNERQKKEEGEV